MAGGYEELERMVRKVKEFCEEGRLEVNINKTKAILVPTNGGKLAKVKYDEEELECINQYVYLASVFSFNGQQKYRDEDKQEEQHYLR
jgi:hypothetical protein